MRISQLPAQYYELAHQRIQEQGREIEDDSLDWSLSWSDTPEGSDFWSDCHHAEWEEDLPALPYHKHNSFEEGSLVFNTGDVFRRGDKFNVFVAVESKPLKILDKYGKRRKVRSTKFTESPLGIGDRFIITKVHDDMPDNLIGKSLELTMVEPKLFPERPFGFKHPEATGYRSCYWLSVKMFTVFEDVTGTIEKGTWVKLNEEIRNQDEYGIVVDNVNKEGLNLINVEWYNSSPSVHYRSELVKQCSKDEIVFIPDSIVDALDFQDEADILYTGVRTKDLVRVLDENGFELPLFKDAVPKRELNNRNLGGPARLVDNIGGGRTIRGSLCRIKSIRAKAYINGCEKKKITLDNCKYSAINSIGIDNYNKTMRII